MENLKSENIENMMTCPHCHTQVSHGAKVCRGCQAEIEYGTPNFIASIFFILSIIIGVK